MPSTPGVLIHDVPSSAVPACLSVSPSARWAVAATSFPTSAHLLTHTHHTPFCCPAYLSNMAVDVTLRRFGHARQMLAAAEALTRAAGHSCVWLHARLGDDAAQQLYLSSGYREVERDSFLAKLQGITPRSLMTKEL